MNQGKSDVNPKDVETVRAAFGRHGYGFQYAVIRECRQLEGKKQSVFYPDGVEYPVQLNGADLHIDFLLRSRNALLTIECKRVDPAFGTWCFARSSDVAPNSLEPKRVVLETLLREDESRLTILRGDAEISERQYHVGLEIKDNDVKGNSTGRGLDGAVTQALRAAAGIIVAAGEHPALIGDRLTRIVPVIVTTARLMTCDTDLAQTDVTSGHLPCDITVSQQPWLWYRVMVSPSLRHLLPWYEDPNRVRIGYSFGHLQDYAYARSVAIVNVAGLGEFLHGVRVHTGDY